MKSTSEERGTGDSSGSLDWIDEGVEVAEMAQGSGKVLRNLT